ncbi:2348_t:CDS:2 [Funneliformis geosporum]|nr:2348_t:CDS:2 [Funneliformis geosporum]
MELSIWNPGRIYPPSQKPNQKKRRNEHQKIKHLTSILQTAISEYKQGISSEEIEEGIKGIKDRMLKLEVIQKDNAKTDEDDKEPSVSTFNNNSSTQLLEDKDTLATAITITSPSTNVFRKRNISNSKENRPSQEIHELVDLQIPIAGIGTITYFIKQALTTLNHNITQTQSSLQTKRTEQTQNPQNNNLPTEINQLEQQLITYQAQKQKVETIILKLELQIVSLSQGNGSEPKQEQSISQLESEIKEINQELGIKEEPKEKKPDNNENPKSPTKNPESPKEKDDDLPNKDKKDTPPPKLPDDPKKDNPNLAEFQTLRENTKSLIIKLEKMIE